MADGFGSRLSGRERQIMEIVYQRGRATAAEVLEGLPDPPSYSAVRALLRVLEEKGHVRHGEDGGRYVYHPTKPRKSAARSALEQVVRTFFAGSVEDAVAALVTDTDLRLSDEELERLARRLAEVRNPEQTEEAG